MISCNCVCPVGIFIACIFWIPVFWGLLTIWVSKAHNIFSAALEERIASFGSTARLEKRAYVTHAGSFQWSLYSFCPLNLTLRCDFNFFFLHAFGKTKIGGCKQNRKIVTYGLIWQLILKGPCPVFPPSICVKEKIYGLWGWLSQCSICPCTSLRIRITNTHIEDGNGDVCIWLLCWLGWVGWQRHGDFYRLLDSQSARSGLTERSFPKKNVLEGLEKWLRG